jgi:hypothetical protein
MNLNFKKDQEKNELESNMKIVLYELSNTNIYSYSTVCV